MGNFGGKTFTALRDEPGTSDCDTPPKRILSEDPRSPTVEVTRTPIAVNKTPNTDIDPRSPSYCIVRTPLYEDPNDMLEDHNTDANRSQLTLVTGESSDKDDTSLDLSPLMLNVSEPDDEPEPEMFETPVNTKEKLPLVARRQPKADMVYPDEQKHTTYTDPVQRTRLSLRTSSASQRSPLTPIHNNSPKLLLQRKQIAQLAQDASKGNLRKKAPTASKYQTVPSNTGSGSKVPQKAGKENVLEVTY